ncbi:MAG TPA: DUF6013 family protein [Trinickia sp.]|jgi:hypothetical protein|nr:DUF6013 family protein [Trinickia sp.]
MSVRPKPFVASAFALAVALAAGGVSIAAHAAPPITVTSKAPADGPIQYTVKVVSKSFGDAQDTRTIRSSETDDFTWRSPPPGGVVSASDQCPNYASLPVDPNGDVLRELRIRLAPIVAPDGMATVQMSVQASAPHGKVPVKVGGKTLQCPGRATLNQVVRFTMPTNGRAKTVALRDGSQVTVSAKR